MKAAAKNPIEAALSRESPRIQTEYAVPALMTIGAGRHKFTGAFTDFSRNGARFVSSVALGRGSVIELVMLRGRRLAFRVVWRKSEGENGFAYGLAAENDEVDLTRLFSHMLGA